MEKMLRTSYWHLALASVVVAAVVRLASSLLSWESWEAAFALEQLRYDAQEVSPQVHAPYEVASGNDPTVSLHKRVLDQPILPFEEMRSAVQAGQTFYNATLFADIAGANAIIEQKIGPDPLHEE